MTLPNYCFRHLSPEEEETFREYARKNAPDPERWDLYHPVCRDEWLKITPPRKAQCFLCERVLTMRLSTDSVGNRTWTCPHCGGQNSDRRVLAGLDNNYQPLEGTTIPTDGLSHDD